MKGLTLIEILIVMAVGTVLGLLLLTILVNSAGLFYKQSAKVSQGLRSNDSLTQIVEKLRESSSVAATYQDGSTVYTSGPTQLVLKIPSTDSEGNLISDTFDHFVFFLDNNILRLKSFPNAQSSRKMEDKVLSLNAENVLFQYFSLQKPPQEVSPPVASKIKISLTLKQKSGADFTIITATSEANLRN